MCRSQRLLKAWLINVLLVCILMSNVGGHFFLLKFWQWGRFEIFIRHPRQIYNLHSRDSCHSSLSQTHTHIHAYRHPYAEMQTHSHMLAVSHLLAHAYTDTYIVTHTTIRKQTYEYPHSLLPPLFLCLTYRCESTITYTRKKSVRTTSHTYTTNRFLSHSLSPTFLLTRNPICL